MNSNDDTIDRTRRAILGSAAALGGAALAGCSGNGGNDQTSTTSSTHSSTSSVSQTSTSAQTSSGPKPAPDVPVLNYALTLEHLEATFYAQALTKFSDSDLAGANVLSKFGKQVRMDVPKYLKQIRDQEAAHVEAITNTIGKLHGDAVAKAEYDFGYKTPSGFLKTAAAFENLGVAAYTGAAPKIVNNDVLTAAAGIQSVEARHAAFLNLVNGTVPFPTAVEKAKSVNEVLKIAGKYITSQVDADKFQTGSNRPKQQRKKPDGTSDIDVLNYALTLEHLENNFYAMGRQKFSDTQLKNADALSSFDDRMVSEVPGYLRTIGQHEAAHVKAITSTIKKLGGKPVGKAKYDFGVKTADDFYATAKAFENLGVAAYKGAAPTVSADAVFEAAVGIHAVEARHAAFLNELETTSPFPNAVDKPKTMAQVEKIAGNYISG